MVGLRSGNTYDFAPTTGDGPSGNPAEMDARSGTSTPTTEMDAQGTSAAEMDAVGTSGDNIGYSGPHEPRSSFAAETEYRSRLADVDDEPRPSTAAVAERRSRTAGVDENDVSHHRQEPVNAIVDGGAVPDDMVSHHRQEPVDVVDGAGAVSDDVLYCQHHNNGFETPKRAARTSRGAESPQMDTTPKFFGSWFSGDDAHMGTELETGTVDKDAFIKRWADGLGDIPSEWDALSQHSLSPLDTGIEFSFDEGMSPTTRNTIERRAARMKDQRMRTPQSVSLTSNRNSVNSRKTNGTGSRHTIRVSRDTAVALTSTRSSLASTMPRYTASAKGKGRDPLECLNIGPATHCTKYDKPSSSSSSPSSSSERADDEARLRQIEADAQLARIVQRALDEQRRADDLAARSKLKAKKGSKTRSSSHKAEKLRTGAEKPSKAEDKMPKNISSKHSSKHSSRNKCEGSSNPAPPLARKSALDQVPEKSYLFKILENGTNTHLKV
ncbi:hypothetical protein B0H10DRAFT_1964755 [Mycena sp. CBHHK59/15]|nr:hypothetical protein B0H10DRAFT_1964755 [Mycena sp. CBHHK59/15]